MDAEVLETAAVVLLFVGWFIADGFARTRRRPSRRSRGVRVRPVEERAEILDPHALSASDD